VYAAVQGEVPGRATVMSVAQNVLQLQCNGEGE
jgi:hypothetical protein